MEAAGRFGPAAFRVSEAGVKVDTMKKTKAFGACVALGAGTLVSGVCWGESTAERLAECTHVVDLSARLRCYDEHMAQLGYKVGVSTPAEALKPAAPIAAAPPSTVKAAPAVAAQAMPSVSEQSEFGIDPQALRKKREAQGMVAPQGPQELVARVKAISTRAHGELSVELENDQLWVETQHSGEDALLEVGETVTIKPGRLGSFFLTRESGRALRVKRIR